MAHLLKDEALGEVFADGAIASFRLSPQDYHRFHSPVTGSVSEYGEIPGNYFHVDPMAITSRANVLGMNARRWVCLQTEDFGKVLFVAVGAVNVGTVR
jgi:phosphatidylserine decarboxylase